MRERNGLAAPVVEELAGRSGRVEVPELLKRFLEKISADGFQVVTEDIVRRSGHAIRRKVSSLILPEPLSGAGVATSDKLFCASVDRSAQDPSIRHRAANFFVQKFAPSVPRTREAAPTTM